MVFMLPVFTLSMTAQHYSTDSRRAARKFGEALEAYQEAEYTAAEEALLKAILFDETFIEAYQLLAQLYFDHDRIGEAIESYAGSLEIDPEGNPDGYRILAGMTMMTGDYRRTLALVDRFLEFPPEAVRNREEALHLKESCLFALEALENPVPFRPQNLGDSVNSSDSEYWPSLSVDENMLMFTVLLPMEEGTGHRMVPMQEDLFYSVRSGRGWGKRINAGPPLNTPNNEGAQTITADGEVLYFTGCNRYDGKGRCDLYISRWKDGNWSRPVNLGTPVNSRYSEKHPSISADGRELYFSSDRPGGKGSYDIWMSTRTGDEWSIPVNLGDSINTPQLEQSPFIHPDGRTLYFSSSGWPGMGRGDLFLSRMGEDGRWSTPENMGYPVNTHNDEIGLTVNARGDRAYFASDRDPASDSDRGSAPDSARDTDIYTFEMPEKSRPVLVSYMEGRVYDSRNMRGVGARIELIDLGTERVVMEVHSEPGRGDFLVPLPTDRDYALNVSAEEYLFYSDHFTFSGRFSRKEPFRKDIPLERIDVGSSVVLNNIFFDTESHELRPASVAELNRVCSFLKDNPRISVEISGHTDSTGNRQYNQELSEQRASAVVSYLIYCGIGESRLTAAGYADRIPVADNATEAGRALNRRTELKIIRVD